MMIYDTVIVLPLNSAITHFGKIPSRGLHMTHISHTLYINTSFVFKIMLPYCINYTIYNTEHFSSFPDYPAPSFPTPHHTMVKRGKVVR